MRPTVFILVLTAAAVGGSARRGVWRTEGYTQVCVCLGNTGGWSVDIHGENEGQDTKSSTNGKRQRDRRRVWGAGVPQTCTAPCLEGEPQGRTDRHSGD